MITLYTFGRAAGLPDLSPFVTKATMLLKLSGLPYRTDSNGFRKAPKGKLPYIDDGGTFVADSTFIRWHIEQRYRFDFDQGLSSAERGIAWSVEKMLEDNVYWAVLESRWCDDANFARGPGMIFRRIPWPLRMPIQGAIRRKVARNLKAHGMGRHSKQEIVALAAKSIESAAAILGEKPYLMGEQPCGADATLYAFVTGMLCKTFDTPIRTAAESHPNLVAYNERMTRQYFPDLADGR